MRRLCPKGHIIEPPNRRCPICERARYRSYNASRPAHHKLYQTNRWKVLAARLKEEQPWCSRCGRSDLRLAVDHIVPVNQGGEFFERDNLRVLCITCNTMRGRGG